jgi:hypothetical protein
MAHSVFAVMQEQKEKQIANLNAEKLEPLLARTMLQL